MKSKAALLAILILIASTIVVAPVLAQSPSAPASAPEAAHSKNPLATN
jgi:hypothetical protein